MNNLAQLEKKVLTPDQALIDDMKRLEGDLLILGVGGKMGPSLAVLAKQALTAAAKDDAVIGVSRFSDASVQQHLEEKEDGNHPGRLAGRWSTGIVTRR